MFIKKGRLKFSGNDLNLKFQLNSKNDIVNNSLNGLVENVGNSLINPIVDGEVCRFNKTYIGGSPTLYFYFYDKVKHYNQFIYFDNNEISNRKDTVLNSFFILDFYDSFNSNTQNKIFTTYLTKIINFSTDKKNPKYSITNSIANINQLSFFDVPLSHVNKQNGNDFICYIKFSFYNAKTGNLSIFYNQEKYNNPLVNKTEELMYFKIYFYKDKTWYIETPVSSKLLAYELPSSQYVDKVNDSFDKIDNIEQTYPEGGMAFNSRTGTYI